MNGERLEACPVMGEGRSESLMPSLILQGYDAVPSTSKVCERLGNTDCRTT
jgi:hypothetical protein